MKSTSCSVCRKGFTRPDNLSRHMRNAHGSSQPYPQSTRPPPPPSPPPPPPPPDFINSPEKNMVQEGMMDDKFQFVHPFTMIVSGPTMSGKPTFIKNLLLLHEHLIHPAPERILWIYKRWQPLYDELKNGYLV